MAASTVGEVSLADYFDRVVVINLDRRPDRWEAFCRRIAAADWPFKRPERFSAVDGAAVTPPMWWTQGGGAWGCLMSHARILEDAIRTGVERLLIIEDDAVFVEKLREGAQRFLSQVPADWDQLYLGGQHLLNPYELNEAVYRCRNVNRTHCHAVSRRFMQRMYRYILHAPDYLAQPSHHIDHRLGALQETQTVNAYAPVDWLAGQGDGLSDVSARSNATFFWNAGAKPPETPLFVVLGLHEGRARDVAGLMKDLGVHFGHHLRGFREPAVEDAGLGAICERVFPFPSTERRLTPAESAPLLHDWCRLILQEAATRDRPAAAVYPHLCALYDDLARAWPRLRVIDVPCTLEAGIAALAKRSERASGWLHIAADQVRQVQTFLFETKQQWLRHCEVLTIKPERLGADRARVKAELSEFLGVRARRRGSQSGA